MMNHRTRTDHKVIIPTTAVNKHPKMMNHRKQTDHEVIIPTRIINKSPKSDYKVIIPTKLMNMPDKKIMISTRKKSDGQKLSG